MNKKGMETWQLMLMILAVLLLIFLIVWYASLGSELGGLFERLEDIL